MADTTRAYFDTFFSLAEDARRRVSDFANRFREDLSAGGGWSGGRDSAVADMGRLIRHEVDAGLARLGLAAQADVEEANLRLDHLEQELRDLRARLAAAERRASATSAGAAAGPSAGAAENGERA